MSTVNKQIRIARPSDTIDDLKKFYIEGLGFSTVSEFDVDGYRGIILSHKDHGYHLEFIQEYGIQYGKAPSHEHLLVFYFSDISEWQSAIARMKHLGFHPVESYNPYWVKSGVTYEDADGYRVVLRNSHWQF
jgi:catechol 2,3-dioxygenase-like lactoylglutathione lyase family enzyme